MSDTEVDETPDGAAERHASFLPAPVDHDRRSEVLRSALVVVPLVLGVLVVAVVGARLLTAEIPDRSATANRQAPERCWDGEPKPDDGCPVPTGRAGLRWVFPSLRPDASACRDAAADFPRSTRPTMWLCEVEADDGTVTVLYSQLTRVARARASYVQQYGEPEVVEDEIGRRLRWRETEPGADGDYDLVLMYASLPFSAELSADTEAALDQALESVRFRVADDVMDHS